MIFQKIMFLTFVFKYSSILVVLFHPFAMNRDWSLFLGTIFKTMDICIPLLSSTMDVKIFSK